MATQLPSVNTQGPPPGRADTCWNRLDVPAAQDPKSKCVALHQRASGLGPYISPSGWPVAMLSGYQ